MRVHCKGERGWLVAIVSIILFYFDSDSTPLCTCRKRGAIVELYSKDLRSFLAGGRRKNMVRFQGLFFVVLLVVFSIGAPAAAAGEWYVHDDPDLYWYWHKDPYFEIALPAEPVSWGERTIFGEELLQFFLPENTPVLTVGIVPAAHTNIELLRDALVARWSYQLSNTAVDTDQRLESSRGLEFYFHLVTGDTPDGKRAMLRNVFYERDDYIVYLTLVAHAEDYTVDSFVRKAWLEAVNSFNWR